MNPLTSTFSAPTLAIDKYNNIYLGAYNSGSRIAVIGLENLVLTDRWEYGAVTTGSTGVIGTLSVSADVSGVALGDTLSVGGASDISNTLDVTGETEPIHQVLR